MTWIDILGLILSVLSLLGVGVITKNFWEDKHKKKLEETEEKKAQRKEAYQELIREAVSKEIEPLQNDIKDIKQNLRDNTVGTVTLLRDTMIETLKHSQARGYASTTDKANWNELYRTYRELGGNHFKEYVNQWRDAMNALPLRPTLESSQLQNIESLAKRNDENSYQ